MARGNRHLPAADVRNVAGGNGHLPTADVNDSSLGECSQTVSELFSSAPHVKRHHNAELRHNLYDILPFECVALHIC